MLLQQQQKQLRRGGVHGKTLLMQMAQVVVSFVHIDTPRSAYYGVKINNTIKQNRFKIEEIIQLQ